MPINPHAAPSALANSLGILPLYLLAAGLGGILFTYDNASDPVRAEMAALEKKHAEVVSDLTSKTAQLDELSKKVAFLEEKRLAEIKFNSPPLDKDVRYTVVHSDPPGDGALAIELAGNPPIDAIVTRMNENLFQIEFVRTFPKPTVDFLPKPTYSLAQATIEVGAEHSTIIVKEGFLPFNDKDEDGNLVPNFPKITNEGIMIGDHIWWKNGEHWVAK